MLQRVFTRQVFIFLLLVFAGGDHVFLVQLFIGFKLTFHIGKFQFLDFLLVDDLGLQLFNLFQITVQVLLSVQVIAPVLCRYILQVLLVKVLVSALQFAQV
ncbi:hypothetical protein D3C87_1429410 [compost metagenome]